MDPREHQRDTGEKEHFPRKEGTEGPDQRGEYVEHKRSKDEKNNHHRMEQTGHAEAEARRVREEAERTKGERAA